MSAVHDSDTSTSTEVPAHIVSTPDAVDQNEEYFHFISVHFNDGEIDVRTFDSLHEGLQWFCFAYWENDPDFADLDDDALLLNVLNGGK